MVFDVCEQTDRQTPSDTLGHKYLVGTPKLGRSNQTTLCGRVRQVAAPVGGRAAPTADAKSAIIDCLCSLEFNVPIQHKYGYIIRDEIALLCKHADRQGVDISVTVGVFVFFVQLRISPPKLGGVKFYVAVYWRSRQGLSQFCELCSPRGTKSDGE